jgi:hypothetical protein
MDRRRKVELFEEILRDYWFRDVARHERSFRMRLHHAGAWFMIGLRRIEQQIQKECRGGVAAVPKLASSKIVARTSLARCQPDYFLKMKRA